MDFTLGPAIGQRIATSYRRTAEDPLYRPLRIFTGDPSGSKLEGKTACVLVPFELLRPNADGVADGQVRGALFEVSMEDPYGRRFAPPRLDRDRWLMQQGHAPSEADPRFHAQMVYAVASLVHQTFRRALGREIGWALGNAEADGEPRRLMLYPFGADNAPNAWYDRANGEIRFGYWRLSEDNQRKGIPTGWVFTSLSHDIIAHEVAHALLDSLKPNFHLPSSTDVAGFHEGFADLVALFHHFQHPQALRAALARSRGSVESAEFLIRIARQFGQASGELSLRSAVGKSANDPAYDPSMEEHDMGEVLLCAVFSAFCTVYRRKTARLLRIATAGTAELQPGELPGDLLDALAGKAAELAGQFLSLIVRAIDYCPPVDIKLGEFLRAMITADAAMVPDDNWGYREALIDAFRERNVYPKGVLSLSEGSLLWGAPTRRIPRIARLSFEQLRFIGDPGAPVSLQEQRDQATALGKALTAPDAQAFYSECGLTRDGDDLRKARASVGLPRIESVRTLRRTGPDGVVVFETVAEVVQTCSVRAKGDEPGFDFIGGATIVLSAEGEVKQIVRKSIAGPGRIARRRAFITGSTEKATRYWEDRGGKMQLRPQWFKRLDANGSAA
jgi:hypothetical protein